MAFKKLLGTRYCAGKVVDSNGVSGFDKLRRVYYEAILRDLDPLIIAIQQIERLGDQFQFQALPELQAAGQAQVSGGVVGADQRVARNAGQTVVGVVAILIGVAGHGRAHRPPAADGDHA